MITSMLLAKFFGFILVIVTLALLFNRKNFDLVLKLFQERVTVLAKGMVNTLLGIILLLFHNVWVTGLDIMITLFCWLILIVGLIDLFFPKYMTGMVGMVRKNKGLGTFALVIFLLLGVYFIYAGFSN